MARPVDTKVERWMQAAERGDLAAVIDFLDSGMDVNAGDAINTTALMRAVRGGHLGVIRVLLDRGASLSPQNTLGHTAVTVALIYSRRWAGYYECPAPDPKPLEMLLAAGARYGLREAVLLNDVALARARLDEGADPNTGEGTYEGPLLKIAAELDHLDIVNLLLDRGARIEATDDLGRRPLLSAASYGRTAVVRQLLDRGADLNGDDWSDQTALSEAAVHGHQDVAALLLSRGAERRLLDAVALDDADLVERLLADGGDPNHIYYSEVSRLAWYAVSRGNPRIVRLMLDHGAIHHYEPFDAYPLLSEGARKGHVDVVKLLIERGTDLHAVGSDGKTALDLATEGGHKAVLYQLIQAGAAPRPLPPSSGTAEVSAR
jgi:ankyrin repeat protein